MYTFPFHIYFEILAFLTSVIFWRKLKRGSLKWLPVYLFFIVCVEVLGWYLPVYLHQYNTGLLFNFSVPIEYLFFSYLFYKSFAKKFNRLFTTTFSILLIAYVLVYSFQKATNVMNFNAYYLLIGSFAMIWMSIAYFLEQFYKNETDNVWNVPMFWITTGVLFFNIGEFSFNMVSTFVIENKLDPVNILFRQINNKLVILLYILITIGLIVCQKNSKPLSNLSTTM